MLAKDVYIRPACTLLSAELTSFCRPRTYIYVLKVFRIRPRVLHSVGQGRIYTSSIYAARSQRLDNRFQLIFEFFHFNDNSNPQDPNRDRLFKIRPVLDYLMDKFKSVYTPDKHIAIDKELLLWKGRLGFKQYIPNTRACFRIKMFSVCEVPGYLRNSSFMSGKMLTRHLKKKPLSRNLKRAVLFFQNLWLIFTVTGIIFT